MNTTADRKCKGYTDHGGRITRDDGIVEAVRYYRSEGASFSGWVVRSIYDPHSYSDPIPTKVDAAKALLAWDTSDVTVDADGTIRKA